MAKNKNGTGRRDSGADSLPSLPELRVSRYRAKEFKPLNDSQATYLNKIDNNIITFCIGPAGTGKTMCAAIAAAKAFKDGEVEKIIITRPAVEAGEELGFLPGDINEKFLPYVAPFVDALSQVMGSGQVEALVQHGKIVFLPLAYMRGHSFNKAFVIADEMQNVTRSQMKLFLTRVGQNTKVVVDGDISQKDINVDGLEDGIERLARVKSVAVHRFQTSDIVRSGIARDVILAYSDEYEDEESDEGLNRYLSK